MSDPKLCILAHLMSPLEPVDPILESPLSHPLLKQKAVASELLNEVKRFQFFFCCYNYVYLFLFLNVKVQQANTAVGGMLLANMERTGNCINNDLINIIKLIYLFIL